MFRRLSAFALALLLAGCAATPAPESAAATATPSPSAALTPTPGRCPTYEEAMTAAAGPGETGEGAYTDADACLQNATRWRRRSMTGTPLPPRPPVAARWTIRPTKTPARLISSRSLI